MSIRRLVLFSLVAVLAVPSSVLAQDEDALAPPLLPPSSKPTKTKASKPKVVKKKKAERPPKKPPRTKATATAKGTKKKPPVSVDDSPLVPLAPAKTELAVVISGNVRGARMTLDGRDSGVLTATPTPLTVSPGVHTVVVRKPGYAEYTRSIDVQPGGQTDLKVSLEPTMGFARALADVAGTVVLVDDVEVGTVPLSDILLKPGRREIEFRASGYKSHIHNINVLPGTSYELTGRMRPLVDTGVASRGDAPKTTLLEPTRTPDEPSAALTFPAESETPEVESSSKPWYGRWYVWAGVGAVVAAGTVGAVMVAQNADPKAPNEATLCGGVRCDITLGNGVRPARGGASPAPTVGGLRF